MSRSPRFHPIVALSIVAVGMVAGISTEARRQAARAPATRHTAVSIRADSFLVNGEPTLKGIAWRGHRMEGLLPNSRMVQGIFDDLNPETRGRWAYPDTKTWDGDRNTREFVAAMAEWRRHGLLAVTLNLQGGSPEGYSQDQPWHNSAFTGDGALRPDYMARAARSSTRPTGWAWSSSWGSSTSARTNACATSRRSFGRWTTAVDWVLDKGYRNVLIEINNECNVRYDHAVLQPARVHELIERAKGITRDGRRLLVSTSYGGSTLPGAEVLAVSDFLLLHGNGVANPDRIAEMVRQTRAASDLRAQADRLQRGRSLRLRQAVEQLRGGDERTCVVGVLRFPPQGRSLRRGLPERARRLGHLVGPQARVLQPGE